MLEIIQSDYIRTAKAKGLSQRQVIWKHAFRNSLFPLITLIAVILPASITGSVIIENIFNIPGLGYQLLAAINSQNWPIVYALLMLTAVLTVLGLLLADILYALADPRVSFSHHASAHS
jgi:peptide/nickel transport system permease protein